MTFGLRVIIAELLDMYQQRLSQGMSEIIPCRAVPLGKGHSSPHLHRETSAPNLLKFDVVNISRYHARPNTISARLKQISGDELKNRTRKMAKVFNVVALERNRNWIGWKGEIIIDEKGILEGTWVGRNYAYKPVVVRGDFKIGDMLNVKITDAASFDLRGEI